MPARTTERGSNASMELLPFQSANCMVHRRDPCSSMIFNNVGLYMFGPFVGTVNISSHSNGRAYRKHGRLPRSHFEPISQVFVFFM